LVRASLAASTAAKYSSRAAHKVRFILCVPLFNRALRAGREAVWDYPREIGRHGGRSSSSRRSC